MNILDKSSTYLIGPLDFAKDHGTEWRQKITPELNKMNVTVLDPTNKPGGYLSETKEEQRTIKEFKDKKDYNSLRSFMKKIRRYDLRLVDNADFIIAYIDTSIHMCGSYDEIFTAEDQQKPILYIVKGGTDTLSSWMFAVIDDFDTVFESLEDCIKYIKEINEGKVELNSKWVLYKKLIEA